MLIQISGGSLGEPIEYYTEDPEMEAPCFRLKMVVAKKPWLGGFLIFDAAHPFGQAPVSFTLLARSSSASTSVHRIHRKLCLRTASSVYKIV